MSETHNIQEIPEYITGRFELTESVNLEEVKKQTGKDSPILGRFVAEIQQADHRNQNGRYYSLSIMEREVRKIQAQMTEGRVPGQADHPEADKSPSLLDQIVLWEKVWIDEDKKVMGQAAIMNTSKGRDFHNQLRAGFRPGVSSRGRGSFVRKLEGSEPTDYVNEDYDLRTFDVVVDPSVATAIVRRIEESKEAPMKPNESGGPTVKEIEGVLESLTPEQLLAHLPEAARSKLAEHFGRGKEIDELKSRVSTLETSLKEAKEALEEAQAAEPDAELVEQATARGELIEKLIAVLENFGVQITGGVPADKVAELLKAQGIEVTEGLMSAIQEATVPPKWGHEGERKRKNSKPTDVKNDKSSPPKAKVRDDDKGAGSGMHESAEPPAWAQTLLEDRREASAKAVLKKVAEANVSLYGATICGTVLESYLRDHRAGLVEEGMEEAHMTKLWSAEDTKATALVEQSQMLGRPPKLPLNEDKSSPEGPTLSAAQQLTRRLAGIG